MGAGASNNGGVDMKTIDRIATDYILSMSFQDMENMNTESGCNNMILIAEDILKKNTTEVELQDSGNESFFNLAAKTSETTSVFVYPDSDKKPMDVSDPKVKISLCRDIAKFYVQIANLFSAIIITVNPKYQYTKDGETIMVGIMDKNKIPEEYLKSISIVLDENFCSKRERLLTSRSKLDTRNEISIAIPYCSMDDKLNPFVGDTGIKELEELFKDEYNPSSGVFSMSARNEQKYKKSVRQFYEAMYDTGTGTSTGTAPSSFSELKYPNYGDERGCSSSALHKVIGVDVVSPEEAEVLSEDVNDDEPPFKKTYIGTDSGLYSDFKKNIIEMKKTMAEDSTQIFSKLSEIFDLSADPITLNKTLTRESIQPVIVMTRELIIDSYYYNCEKHFNKGLEIFRNIVYQSLIDQQTGEIKDLGNLKDKLSNG